MKKKKREDKLAVSLGWHVPKRRNALDSMNGRHTRFMVFTLALVGCVLAAIGVMREFM